MLLDKEFPPDIRVEHEITALSGANHEVVLACCTREQHPWSDGWQDALVYRKKISAFRQKTAVGCLKFPLYFDFWRPYVRKLQAQYRFGAVHVHDLPLARMGAEMQDTFGIPLVLDLHENWPALLDVSPHVRGPLGRLLSSPDQWRRYEQEMVAAAAAVIVVVEENRQRLAQFTEYPAKLYLVSNTPVIEELGDLSSLSQPRPRSMRIFYGGGIQEMRGLQDVIRALAQLVEAPIELHVVGSGKYLHKLQALAERQGVAPRVEFYGRQPLQELLRLMRKSDLLLIPHLKAEFSDTTVPHKLFQYMSTDKPILASNCVPVQRVLQETAAGTVYTAGDVAALARELQSFYQRWQQGDAPETGARKHVLARYNWDVDKQVLIALYDQLHEQGRVS